VAAPLGSTPGIIVGVGVGAAASAALEPAVELPRQKAWADNPNRLLDPGLLARLVAQGGIQLSAAQAEARRDGYDADKVDALVYLAQTVPPIAEALDLWRKGLISDALWTHVLVKSGVDARYVEGLTALKTAERLNPAVIALAIVRGIMHDPGFLPVSPPTGTGRVEKFPTSSLGTLDEAAASGWDEDRLFVQTAISGRPMGPEAAASAVFRDILLRVDYDRAVSEGDVRNEWADAIFETSRQIATANDYVQAHLRGWITELEMYEGAARHGMSREDAHLLFLRSGRPPSPTQMWTAWAREARSPGGDTFTFEDFAAGIKQSDIRPEYVNTLWDIRFNYPSLFQMRQLVSSGVLPRAEALDILHKQRYPDALAVLMVDGWTRGGTARMKELTAAQLDAEYEGLYITQAEYLAALEGLGYLPHEAQMMVELGDARRVKAQRDKTVEAIRKAYLKHTFQQPEAEGLLVDEGLPAEAIGLIMHEWNLQLQTERANLTPTQIRRAYVKGVLSRADALAALEDLGYSATEAAVLLDS
jgi:hypothetical protein